MFKNIKVGSDITLVSKGIVKGYNNSTWTDSTIVGQTSFMRVTKIGTKYIYGVHFCFEDGERQNFYYESKTDTENYIILEGIRKDLEEKYRQFRKDLDAYERNREETRRKFEYELHTELNAKMDKWTQDNPRPQPINLENLSTTTP